MAGTTTNYAIPYPTSTDLVKDGATAQQSMATSIDTIMAGANYAGLVLIKTQTIGSAVASVAVTGAFSTTYDNYKIIVSGGASSASAYITFAMTGSAATYDYNFVGTTYASTTVVTDRGSAATSFVYGGVGNTTNGIDVNIELEQPFLAQYTSLSSTIVTDTIGGRAQSRHKTATSYTGFTIAPQSGTLTGGTIAVYGYRKAI